MLSKCYNNTAVGNMILHSFDQALSLFRQPLELKYTLDETAIPHDISVSVYNICRVQMGKGLMSEAAQNVEKALQLVERCSGPSNFWINQFLTYTDLLIATGDVERGSSCISAPWIPGRWH